METDYKIKDFTMMQPYDFFFPGWTKKSITFTIDDGNIPLDKKFMAITEPAGLKGTFNLCTPLWEEYTPEDYREIYKGYEITDHCRYHAYPFTEELRRPLATEIFDPETADPALLYPTGEEGLFKIKTYDWCYQANDQKFLECAESCKKDLEAIFGQGTVKDFIWPCGKQENETVFQGLIADGFRSIRNAGCTEDSGDFNLPTDRFNWSYNANYTNLLPVAEKYEAFPEDGKLKFFCFGVHAHDFERAGRWDVLEDFCKRYGNRPEDFYYASVGTLFDYEDAVKSVYEKDSVLFNPSHVDLYLLIGGKRQILRAGRALNLL